MWRFKYLLIGVAISGALGAVLFFVARYVYDEFKAELEQDAIAAVDDYFVDNPLPPVTDERIVLSERDLTAALRRADEGSSTFDQEGLAVDLVRGEIRIVDANPADGDSTNLASVTPQIVNGRIELGDPDGVVAIFVPMGSIADEIELQVFNYLNENDVTPTSIEVTDRELIVTVEPKPGTTLGTPAAATPRAGAATPSPRTGSRTPPARPATTPTAEPTDTPAARATAVGTLPTINTPTPAAAAPTATRAGILSGLRTRTPAPTPTP